MKSPTDEKILEELETLRATIRQAKQTVTMNRKRAEKEGQEARTLRGIELGYGLVLVELSNHIAATRSGVAR